MIKRTVFIRCSFEGFHHWPDAPDHYSFLRDIHRHIFYVEAAKLVSHSNRDIEFIDLKRQIWGYCVDNFGRLPTTLSCEQMAEILISKFDLCSCAVLEDDENGSYVYHTSDAPEITLHTSPTEKPEVRKSDTRFNSRMFVGHEAEGPADIRGVTTLFIPGSYQSRYSDIAGTMAQVLSIGPKKSVRHVYLGADNDYDFQVETIEHIATLFSNSTLYPSRLIIEVDSLNDKSEAVLEALEKLTATFAKKVALSPKVPAGRCLLVTRSMNDILDHLYQRNMKFSTRYLKIVNDTGIYWIDAKVMFTNLKDSKFRQDIPVEDYLAAGGEFPETEEECDEEFDN